jgi:hypothetical protein
MRRDPGGFYRPSWKARTNPYLRAGYSFLSCSPVPPGVKQAPNHPRVESGNMGTVRICLLRKQAIRGDLGRMRTGRSPRRSLRTDKARPRGEGGQEAEVFSSRGNTLWTQSTGRYGPIPSVQRNMLSGVAEICRGLRRAGYIAKGVRPVRRGTAGNRWLRGHTAPVVYSTRCRTGRSGFVRKIRSRVY